MPIETRMVNERQDELYKQLIGGVKDFAAKYPADAYNEILGIVGLMCGYVIATAPEDQREGYFQVLSASVQQGLHQTSESQVRN